MKTSELRQRFLDYFAARGHRVVASSSVVGPADDPTVMWTNAGMVQFKDVFLGKEKREYTRAVTSQKCLRAGGKHNDLDQVGFTARHHTFFEMLGNFSFGDYFKAEAIRSAWELVTGPLDQGCLGLDPARLWVTVYEGAGKVPADTEAEELWFKVGVPRDRVVRCGSDNFWQMGDTGPCGPCSEIHYDRGPGFSGDAVPNGAGDRVMEIWNLVFMQYDREADGTMKPLPRPSIDTGMGLERVASILQGVDSNYEIDLFRPIFEAIWKKAAVEPALRSETANRTASQVIADHIRAATFMIYDAVVPSNEGRGYVLRKIIRRALRFGRKLGIEGRFFADLSPSVFQAMGDAYPELEAELSRIMKVLAREEGQFSLTLTAGLRQLESIEAVDVLPGSEIFKLYDTYGFPVDLVEDWCRERGLKCDLEGFQRELAEQKAKSRQAQKVHDIRLGGDLAALADMRATAFLGYDVTEAQGKVVALFDRDQKRVKELSGRGFVLLDHTPFYAQSGGQVGDTGTLRAEGVLAQVTDCTAPAPRRHLHHVTVSGARPLREGETVLASVDAERRARIRAHHTATHLLHAALREVLGTHVKQAGSVVDADRLRFDFNHFAPLEAEQVAEVERLVNEQTLGAFRTTSQQMPIEEALAAGAMALFGEKYGDLVRVVSVPGFSRELCGGTHVANTGEIGLVKIVAEAAVAAGVRRLEAVAGAAALARLQEDEHLLAALSRQANSPREKLGGLLAAKEARIQLLEKELKEAKLKAASGGGSAEQVEQVNGLTLVTMTVDGIDVAALREMMDQCRTRHRSAVIALASRLAPDSLAILVSVGPDLTARADAGALLKLMVPHLGGRGGGKKELAQGGGTRPEGLPEAFAALKAGLQGQI